MGSPWPFSLWPLLTSHRLLSFVNFVTLRWACSSMFLSLLYWEAQHGHSFPDGPLQCWAEGKYPLPLPGGNTLNNTARNTLVSMLQGWFMINLLSTLTGFSLQSCFPASKPPTCDGAWKSFQSVKKKIRVTFTKWSKSSRRPPFRSALSVSHMLTTHQTKSAGMMLPLTAEAVMVRAPECATLPSLFSPCPSCRVLKASYGEEKEKLLLITLVQGTDTEPPSTEPLEKRYTQWLLSSSLFRERKVSQSFPSKCDCAKSSPTKAPQGWR